MIEMTHEAYLLSFGDSATGNDDDLVLFVERHNLSDTVGRARVVDVAVVDRTW